MKENNTCLNTKEVGCIWGNMCNWKTLSDITKRNRNLTVEYLGNYEIYETPIVYAVFHTRFGNYFIPII